MCTSVAFSVYDMANLKLQIADLIRFLRLKTDCRISYEEVEFAVCKLKADKDDGDIGLSSDYFMHELYVYINAKNVVYHTS